jgi:hypothetical protein
LLAASLRTFGKFFKLLFSISNNSYGRQNTRSIGWT